MQSKHREVAALLWRLWREGAVCDTLPAPLTPATREDGYAVQAHLEDCAGGPRVGWKIAATSLAGQRHINVDGPMAGRILCDKVLGDGAEVSLDGNRMRVAEPEFAFRLGGDLPPRAAEYSAAEVMGAVAELHLALEMPDSRFADFTRVGGPSLIADDACARDLVLGPPVRADWRSIDLSIHPVRAEVQGRFGREGSGANVLGDPRAAMAWLANELSALGIGLKAGEVVTTGACMVPLEAAPGDSVDADFGALGTIGARFA